MIPVELVGVRIEMPSNQPIVLLKEISGSRFLPIWVGTVEATAIAFAQQDMRPSRPLTHDLLVEVINTIGGNLRSVHITKLESGVFFADLVFKSNDGSDVKISARPSDAIAIAIRNESPILVSEALFDEAGIELPEQGDEEIERFKEFLDEVSPEDFA